jgi:hypothetical protein
VRRNLQLMCSGKKNRRVNRSSTHTRGGLAAQTAVLELMLTLLDHCTGVCVFCAHVHMIHVVQVETEADVCFVMTELELMPGRSIATANTRRGCDRC